MRSCPSNAERREGVKKRGNGHNGSGTDRTRLEATKVDWQQPSRPKAHFSAHFHSCATDFCLITFVCSSHLELVFPLEHTNTASAQHEAAFLNRRRRGDPCQGLPRPARQHDNSCHQHNIQESANIVGHVKDELHINSAQVLRVFVHTKPARTSHLLSISSALLQCGKGA